MLFLVFGLFLSICQTAPTQKPTSSPTLTASPTFSVDPATLSCYTGFTGNLTGNSSLIFPVKFQPAGRSPNENSCVSYCMLCLEKNDTNSDFLCEVGSSVSVYGLRSNANLAAIKGNSQNSNFQSCNTNNCNAPIAGGICKASGGDGSATKLQSDAVLGVAIGILVGVILGSVAFRAYYLGGSSTEVSVGAAAGVDMIPSPLSRQARSPTNMSTATHPSRVGDQRMDDSGL